MKLKEDNFKIFQHGKGFSLKILMPDGSDNYLHNEPKEDLNEVLQLRDMLMDNTFYEQDIKIKNDDTYFRIILTLKDDNNQTYTFHSRKLNLNDIVFERMQLTMKDT